MGIVKYGRTAQSFIHQQQPRTTQATAPAMSALYNSLTAEQKLVVDFNYPSTYSGYLPYLALPESFLYRKEAEIFCNQWDNTKRQAYQLWLGANPNCLPSQMKAMPNLRPVANYINCRVALDTTTELRGDGVKKIKICGAKTIQKKNKFSVINKHNPEYIIIID